MSSYETDDLSNIYEEARKYLWSVAQRTGSSNLPSDLREEAVHEGLIRVWRDLDAGETIKLKILRRAAMRVTYHINNMGETPLGKPKLSGVGATAAHNPILEKIQVFLEEWMPVHDNIWPTSVEIANGVGISRHSALQYLRRIKSGDLNQGKYYIRPDGSRIKDKSHYIPVSVESLLPNDPSGSSTWTDSEQVSKYQETWESSFLDQAEMLAALKELKPIYREVLYRYFYVGDTFTEIGKEKGFKHPSGQASSLWRKALNQLQTLIAPYHGHCDKGHKRTEETTHIFTRTDGTVVRLCKPCNNIQKANDKRRTGNTKKVVKHSKPKVCEEHGPMTLVDSRGCLRCHECRKAAQRKYASKKRNDSTE